MRALTRTIALAVGGLVSMARPLLAADAPLQAATHEAARETFGRGLTLVDAGRYEEAALTFERAYSLEPRRSVLYNAGQAHAAARHFARAIVIFRRYLEGDSSELPAGRAAEVAAELERLTLKTAVLRVTVSPARAELRIDGERVTPAADGNVMVDPGEHSISATLAGYATDERRLQLAEGEKERLTLELTALAQGPTQSVVAASDVPPARPYAARRETTQGPTPRNVPHSSRSAWAAVSAGASVVAAGVTVGLLIDNSHRYRDWQAEQQALDAMWATTPIGQPGPNARQHDNDARAERIQRVDQVATGLAVGSAALLGVAALLFFSDGTPTSSSGRSSGHASLMVGPTRLSLAGYW